MRRLDGEGMVSGMVTQAEAYMNRQILQDCLAGKLDGAIYEFPELIQAITSAKFLVEVKGRADSIAIKTAAGILLAEMDGGKVA